MVARDFAYDDYISGGKVAIQDLNTEVFSDVFKHGTKEVIGTDCVIMPKEVLKLFDEYTDLGLELEAARRLKEDDGVRIPFEKVLQDEGKSLDDLVGWEDVEIE